jgi:hypothetical protein
MFHATFTCEFHGALPLLGFLHNSCIEEHCASHFISTSPHFRLGVATASTG